MRIGRIFAALVLPLALSACEEEDERRPFDAGDGQVLTLLSLEAETKEIANGRTVGYLVAEFEEPEGMSSTQRRPLAEKLCPKVIDEMGAPEEVDGAKLETVLIKYRQKGFEILGMSFGSATNYWVELARGECVTRG